MQAISWEGVSAMRRPGSSSSTGSGSGIPQRSPLRVRRAGIVVKPGDRRSRKVAETLLRFLERKGIEAILDRQTAATLGKRAEGIERNVLAAATDLLVVVGGDGTLLSVARSAAGARTP